MALAPSTAAGHGRCAGSYWQLPSWASRTHSVPTAGPPRPLASAFGYCQSRTIFVAMRCQPLASVRLFAGRARPWRAWTPVRCGGSPRREADLGEYAAWEHMPRIGARARPRAASTSFAGGRRRRLRGGGPKSAARAAARGPTRRARGRAQLHLLSSFAVFCSGEWGAAAGWAAAPPVVIRSR